MPNETIRRRIAWSCGLKQPAALDLTTYGLHIGRPHVIQETSALFLRFKTPPGMITFKRRLFIGLVGGLGLASCGEDSDRLGVGAACVTSEDCGQDQRCLEGFKGGYCGVLGCAADADCPQESRCVQHSDAQRYCFRTCAEKGECNANRDVSNEANCSSNVTFVQGEKTGKACVPPSK